jgi:hypothetical protein
VAIAGCDDHAASPDQTSLTTITPLDIPANVQKLFDEHIIQEERSAVSAGIEYLDPIPTELTDNCDVFAVTFLWGDIFNSTPPSVETTDWSGTLGLNCDGVVHVRYMIDFEPGQDSVLAHNNPTFAAWLSYTAQDFDGLSFLVFIKRDIPNITPPVLTF